MHSTSAGLAESLTAAFALKWLFLEVDVAVVTKMILPSERLAADITGEGPLVRVGPLVNQQVVALAELPLAVLADVAFSGSCRPYGERRLAHQVVG